MCPPPSTYLPSSTFEINYYYLINIIITSININRNLLLCVLLSVYFSAALFSICDTPLDYWTLVGRWMKVLVLTRNDLTRFVIQAEGPDGKWTRKPLAYRESNNVHYIDTDDNCNLLTVVSE